MILPEYKKIRVDNLNSVFNSTTNSYKFYWFLAILENIKGGKSKIAIDEIVIEMIAELWYPINYFKLSFGLQDQFNAAIEIIQERLQLPKDIKKQELVLILLKSKSIPEISTLIKNLSRWVPQRFVRPWFSEELRGVKDYKVNQIIIDLSDKNYSNKENPSLYRFNDNNIIEINPQWLGYLEIHLGILTDFTYWNLNLFLQNRNPNVGNIPIKLFPPNKRNLSNARKFWNIYLSLNDNMKCIYSDMTIKNEEYSLDHFLPWRFTGHDQLWNLLPTPKSINSSKSDNLPNIKCLNNFISIQYNAFHDVLTFAGNKTKLFEDYSLLFNLSVSEIKNIEKQVFITKLIDNIKPQMQIAKNMGFQEGWQYSK